MVIVVFFILNLLFIYFIGLYILCDIMRWRNEVEMNNLKVIIFDLDGILLDILDDIINSCNYILN